MNSLLAIQSDIKMEKDDPHHTPILVFYGQVADAMKEGFSKYLPRVAQIVFNGANINIDVVAEDVIEGSAPKEDYDKTKIAKLNLDLGMLGGMKTIQLNTSALE